MRVALQGSFQGWIMPAAPESITCPICRKNISNPVGPHIRKEHGEEAFKRAILSAKEKGMPDPEIGAKFGISFNKLEAIITETYGANISVLKKA
jgi:hypothetical protein